MAPFRAARSTRSGRQGAQSDFDIVDGLPVRQWRLQEAPIGAEIHVEVQPEEKAATAEPNNPAKQGAWPELPMPRGSNLYAPWCQQLLRAARAGRIQKRKRDAEIDEDRDNDAADDHGTIELSKQGFLARKWTQVPRQMEGVEPEYLAKRRKGLPRTPPNFINGLIDGANGEAVTIEAPEEPIRRRMPPPRRKPKKGPGRKKKIAFADGEGAGGVADESATGDDKASGENGEAKDADGNDVDDKDDGEEDDDEEDGEEGDIQEPGKPEEDAEPAAVEVKVEQPSALEQPIIEPPPAAAPLQAEKKPRTEPIVAPEPDEPAQSIEPPEQPMPEILPIPPAIPQAIIQTEQPPLDTSDMMNMDAAVAATPLEEPVSMDIPPVVGQPPEIAQLPKLEEPVEADEPQQRIVSEVSEVEAPKPVPVPAPLPEVPALPQEATIPNPAESMPKEEPAASEPVG